MQAADMPWVDYRCKWVDYCLFCDFQAFWKGNKPSDYAYLDSSKWRDGLPSRWYQSSSSVPVPSSTFDSSCCHLEAKGE